MNTRELIGKKFKTLLGKGVTFTILSVEAYGKSKISDRYRAILDIKSGFLVAIQYRTALIPNFTLDGGVARITGVEVEGSIFTTAHAISTAIGIKEAMTAYSVKEVK